LFSFNGNIKFLIKGKLAFFPLKTAFRQVLARICIFCPNHMQYVIDPAGFSVLPHIAGLYLWNIASYMLQNQCELWDFAKKKTSEWKSPGLRVCWSSGLPVWPLS